MMFKAASKVTYSLSISSPQLSIHKHALQTIYEILQRNQMYNTPISIAQYP